MRTAILLCLFLAAATAAGAPKTPDATMIEVTARRTGEGLLNVDARVQNTSSRTLHGVRILFQFFDSGHHPVTTQKATLDEEAWEAGAEAEIHAQMEDPARAVSMEAGAFDNQGRELRVGQAGPYPIE